MSASLQQWCTWCRQSGGSLEPDHVFPRAIGGTKQLAVPACPACQTTLSVIEHEAARRSIFALYGLAGGPSIRHKKKPKSGLIEVRYALVKDWMGGYSEVALRVGQLPIILPCIELDVSGASGARVHGLTPGDVDRLVDALLEVVNGSPDEQGFLGELPVELLEDDDADLTADPDFWPRVFLDLGGQLKIRARHPEEAERLMTILVPLAQQGAFRDHSRWITGEVKAGTPHHVSIQYDWPSVCRVIAKIAYGITFLDAGLKVMERDPFGHIRRYILGEAFEDRAGPVRELSQPGTIKNWPEYHLVVVEPYEGHLRGIVALYGSCHLVELGLIPDPLLKVQAVVAMSHRNGTASRLVDGQIARQIRQLLTDHVRQRPGTDGG